MDGNAKIGGGAVTPNPGPAWTAVGTGDFFGNGLSDILWQNTSTGQVSIWEMDENNRIGGGPVTPIPGPSWHAIGTGAGGSDILWQNPSTGQTSIWEMDGNNAHRRRPCHPHSRGGVEGDRPHLGHAHTAL